MSVDPAMPVPPGGDRAEPASRIPIKIEEALAAGTLGLVAVITFANVLTRYFSDFSFAFTEEFSICLMVMMTLFGASVAVVRDRHMRITFLLNKLPPPWRRRAEMFSMTAIAAMFAILTIFGSQFAYDDYRFEVTSPALDIPQWLYSMWLPLLSLVVTGRAVGALMRLARSKGK
jgi:TRAP-type C4-dicarboxylate transport system permease small subunit